MRRKFDLAAGAVAPRRSTDPLFPKRARLIARQPPLQLRAKAKFPRFPGPPGLDGRELRLRKHARCLILSHYVSVLFSAGVPALAGFFRLKPVRPGLWVDGKEFLQANGERRMTKAKEMVGNARKPSSFGCRRSSFPHVTEHSLAAARPSRAASAAYGTVAAGDSGPQAYPWESAWPPLPTPSGPCPAPVIK